MKDKILYLMQMEGLSPSRFAEMLEIQPSSVSHLVSGRNNPRYDMLQKILRRFPKVNPDWLLLDSDQPYRVVNNDLEATESHEELLPLSEPQAAQISPQNSPSVNISEKPKSPLYAVIFYDDGSCERFSMRDGALK